MSERKDISPLSHQVYNRLGSFWTEKFGQKDLARGFCKLTTDFSNVNPKMEAFFQDVISGGAVREAGPFTVRFDPKKVVRKNPFEQERIFNAAPTVFKGVWSDAININETHLNSTDALSNTGKIVEAGTGYIQNIPPQPIISLQFTGVESKGDLTENEQSNSIFFGPDSYGTNNFWDSCIHANGSTEAVVPFTTVPGITYSLHLIVGHDARTGETQVYEIDGVESSPVPLDQGYMLVTYDFVANGPTTNLLITNSGGNALLNHWVLVEKDLTGELGWDTETYDMAALGDATVITEGTLIQAANFVTNETVNGVPFVGVNSPFGDFYANYDHSDLYTGPGLVDITDRMIYGQFQSTSSSRFSHYNYAYISGLTPGNTYLFQLFSSDDRSYIHENQTQSAYIDGWNTGKFIVGRNGSITPVCKFVASAETVQFGMTAQYVSRNASPSMLAFQVRDIT